MCLERRRAGLRVHQQDAGAVEAVGLEILEDTVGVGKGVGGDVGADGDIQYLSLKYQKVIPNHLFRHLIYLRLLVTI